MDYPNWICDPCGRRLGRLYLDGRYIGPPWFRVSTMHDGKCDVCGKTRAVTEPRDYGHLISDWHKR